MSDEPKYSFRIGDTVWHGSRYWKTDNLSRGEVIGWNTTYKAYWVDKITAKQITIEALSASIRITLKRSVMERDGKQYHTRFHEYFYAKHPTPESKEWNWAGSRPNFKMPSFADVFGIECLTILGLSLPVNQRDVKRAYKRLALKTHPDLGGKTEDFVKLKNAYDSALRFATS